MYREKVCNLKEFEVKKNRKRKDVEKDLLEKARIVLTTLSMSGSEKMELLSGGFDYLIVDEAC